MELPKLWPEAGLAQGLQDPELYELFGTYGSDKKLVAAKRDII